MEYGVWIRTKQKCFVFFPPGRFTELLVLLEVKKKKSNKIKRTNMQYHWRGGALILNITGVTWSQVPPHVMRSDGRDNKEDKNKYTVGI